MKLSDLLVYDEITIQSHDNPDADSIAAGFALYTFFKENGKKVDFVYSGRAKISKPNLVLLVEDLHIPIRYVDYSKVKGLLITVDSQFGAGNVTRIEADHVAIIDHHQQEVEDVELSEIRSHLGSCCTLVWRMMKDDGYCVMDKKDVSTALYYGLFSDTNGFTEIRHPTDRDMKDTLPYDVNLIRKLKNSNLSMSDLEIAGIALLRNSYNATYKFAVIKTQPCDPNILGFISDLAIQVDAINVCVVYHEVPTGIKFSVRSCIREVMASELAEYLSYNIGTGGGHGDKAGGFISLGEFNRLHHGVSTDEYLLSNLTKYFGSFTVIDYDTYVYDGEDMLKYKKKPIKQGFVKCTDVFEKGTPIILRTIQCDLDDIVSDDDLYITIDILGEVYPVSKDKFESRYKVLEGKFELDTQYFPHLRNKSTGDIVNLRSYAKNCISKDDVYIYAKILNETVKVFTKWDRDTYMTGKPGDYLIVRADDLRDIYIIPGDMFDVLYEGV